MSIDNFEKAHFNPLNLPMDERVKELKSSGDVGNL